MATTDGKDIINRLYNSALVAAVAIGSANLSKMAFKQKIPCMDFNLKDVAMVGTHIAVGTLTIEYLQKNKIIPQNIVN